jgi:group I intron endonuclease
MFGIIYRITNTETGMEYVGQTVQSLRERWVEHMSHARQVKSQSYMSRALRKYPIEAFVVESIHECESQEELDFVETFYISLLNTKAPNGYNLADGGGGVSGWQNGKGNVPTEETRKRLSEAGKGNTNALGKKYSKEFCEKISVALSKRVRKEESYNTPKCLEKRKNYRHGEEAKAAISAGLKGKPWSEARRAAQRV